MFVLPVHIVGKYLAIYGIRMYSFFSGDGGMGKKLINDISTCIHVLNIYISLNNRFGNMEF